MVRDARGAESGCERYGFEDGDCGPLAMQWSYGRILGLSVCVCVRARARLC
jgi:hypothetical protein